MHDAVNRECLATRNGVGIMDASTLGKIELQGRDVARLLDRVFVNRWDNLAVGRCRYGVMLRDDDARPTRLAVIVTCCPDRTREAGTTSR